MTPGTEQVMIGTPAYGGMVHCDFVAALLQYQHSGLRFALTTIGNESLITRARNTILAEFHARAVQPPAVPRRRRAPARRGLRRCWRTGAT